MKKINFVSSSVFIIVIALLFFTESFNAVRTNNEVSVGPALIPQIIAAALFILAVINWFTSVAKMRTSRKSPVKIEKDLLKKLIGSVMVFLFAVGSFEILGCLISGVIFLAAEILILTPDQLDKRTVIKTVCIASLITVFTFLLFNYAFQVNLPKGIWG